MKKRNLKAIFQDDPEVLALLKKRSADDLAPLMEGLQYLFQGKPGSTPEKGKDYFTEAEKKEFLASVTPQKFKDYFTETEVNSIMEGIFNAVLSELKAGLKAELTPVKGVDYDDGRDGQDAVFDEKKAIDSILKAIPKVKELNPDEIVTKVKEELKTLIPSVEDFVKEVKEKRLIELRDIRGARLDNPKMSMNDQRWHGGGLSNITGLITQGTNVTITGSGTSTDPYVINSSGGAGGIASINADTTSAQVLDVGTAGTDFAIVDNGTGTHTFNLPTASATNRGALSSADWTTFNNKGNGTVTSVSGTANRITSTGGATPVIDIAGTYVGQTSITTLGTIATGTWEGTDVGVAHGGTGVSSISALSVWVANSANTITEVSPAAGQSIRINAGGTAWEAYTPSSGGTPGGNDTEIQFNDAGSFGGDSGLTYNKTSNVVSMNGVGSGQIGTLNITRGDSVNQYIVLTESASSTGSAYLTFAGSNPGAMAMGALYTAGVPTSYVFTNTGGTPILSIAEATGLVNIPSLTASEIVITDASKNLVSAAVATYPSLTELTYLKGVTSSIQTQLSGKQATGNYITALTGDVTASGPGSVAATLATVNADVGSFTNANITVNAKGLITAASNGSAGTPGGSDTQVQYNNGGSFGGMSALTYNDSNLNLTFDGSTTGRFTVYTNSQAGIIDFSSAANLNIVTAVTNLTSAGVLRLNQTSGLYEFDSGSGTISGLLDFSSVATADKTFTFPNLTGTIAVSGASQSVSFGATTVSSLLASANDSGALGASGTAFSDLFLASGGVINFNAGNYTITHSAGLLTLSGGLTATAGTVTLGTVAGAIDMGGATSLEIPNSAAPTVNADGEIAVDTTVTDFSHGIIKFYAGEEQGIISMPVAEFTSPQNGDVPTYNATADEFQLQQPSGGSAVSVTFTADEDITAGQPVGSSNYSPSLSVARANRTFASATLSYTPSDPIQNNEFCPIGGDKYVLLQIATGAENIYATVVTIDPDTKEISLGTSELVTADGVGQPNFSICKLDTDKFIVLYKEDASTTLIKYRVGTVSGSTITLGSAATFYTAGTGVDGIYLDQISTDKGIAVLLCSTATDSRAIAFTVSGTTATMGTPASLSTNADDANRAEVRKIGTDKFVFVNFSTTYVQVGTLSGTTITLGTAVQFSTTVTGASTESSVSSPDTDVFVIGFRNSSSNALDMVAATVSGTVPAFGSILATVALSTVGYSGQWVESTTSILISSSSNNALYKVTRSGNTLTNVGTVTRTTNPSPGLGKIISLDAGYFAIMTVASGTTTYGVFIQGMSNGFIGIAQSTVSKGASVSVVVRGVDANQSGLIPGSYYLASGGTLSFVISNTTFNTYDDGNMVKAISATQVIV